MLTQDVARRHTLTHISHFLFADIWCLSLDTPEKGTMVPWLV
jgi:hypothetical protein